jgi:ABC-type transporter Mla subunit MlaD
MEGGLTRYRIAKPQRCIGENMDLVFTDRNISSICGRYGVKNRASYLEQIRNVLRENAEKINPLGAIFSANNVSSMLNGAGARRPEALTALTDNRETLEELVQRSGFSANNVSSMLSGAGAQLPEALTALTDNRETLEELVQRSGFSANNVSSMLSGAGAQLPEALTALTDNRETLEELVQRSVFSANNVSSMLHGAGARLPEALTGLLNNPELVRRKLGTQKKR